MVRVKLTFKEFMIIKDSHYYHETIRNVLAHHLNIDPGQIDDIDWVHGLYIDVYLKPDLEGDEE